jgi:hypothetical protein
MKPVSTITQAAPLVVHIKKNGRPVQEAIAKRYVEKHFPAVANWKFTKTDHSILAEEQLKNSLEEV